MFVFPGNDSTIHVPFPHIGRTPLADLYTYEAHKNYRPHYEKGRIRPGMETLPFGYRLAQQRRRRSEDENDGDIENRFPGGSNWNRARYQQEYN